jgi:hypothetical protein
MLMDQPCASKTAMLPGALFNYKTRSESAHRAGSQTDQAFKQECSKSTKKSRPRSKMRPYTLLDRPALPWSKYCSPHTALCTHANIQLCRETPTTHKRYIAGFHRTVCVNDLPAQLQNLSKCCNNHENFMCVTPEYFAHEKSGRRNSRAIGWEGTRRL